MTITPRFRAAGGDMIWLNVSLQTLFCHYFTFDLCHMLIMFCTRFVADFVLHRLPDVVCLMIFFLACCEIF